MSPPKNHPSLGPIIEGILADMGMSKAEFGRRISTSRQNVSLILKKHHLDTEMLWRICVAINFDVFHLLSLAFNHGRSPLLPASPQGKLEIRLELGDQHMVHLAVDLVRRIIEENKPGENDGDPPEAPAAVPD